MMTLIAAKSDFICKANEAYRNLQEYEEIFAMEANVLNRAKCLLLQGRPLEEIDLPVSVYPTGSGYILLLEGYRLEIYVYEKQIVDFVMTRQ